MWHPKLIRHFHETYMIKIIWTLQWETIWIILKIYFIFSYLLFSAFHLLRHWSEVHTNPVAVKTLVATWFQTAVWFRLVIKVLFRAFLSLINCNAAISDQVKVCEAGWWKGTNCYAILYLWNNESKKQKVKNIMYLYLLNFTKKQ